MSKQTLTDLDFELAAAKLGCDVAAIKAVDYVESRGRGFLDDGQPIILFERHIFHELTDGAWSSARIVTADRPVNPYRDISSPSPGSYGPAGQHQHDRLARAVKLDRTAALMSASWGRFQIMGFNFDKAGHSTLQGFINAMYRSERDHLEAFVNFLEYEGLAKLLRQHRWTEFARRYNGKGYAKNKYHTRLSAAWWRFNKERQHA